MDPDGRRWGLSVAPAQGGLAAAHADQLAALGWSEASALVDVDLLDRSGMIPSALMVVGVVMISLFKPLVFSRYFVVLIPPLVPVLAVLLVMPS